MKLTLNNIGKVKDATIELNGITVIAGENNTGKSTVGKVLYCIFNSFYNIEDQIQKERVQSITRILDMMYRSNTNRLISRVDTEEITLNILKQKNRNNYEELKREILESFSQFDENFDKHIEKTILDDMSTRILEILNVSDDNIFKTVLTKKLDVEFNGQVNNIFSEDEGYIDLNIKGDSVHILIKENNVINITKKFDLKTEVVYIDDPFILDDQRTMPLPLFLRYGNYVDHRSHLKMKLFTNSNEPNIISEIVATKKLDNIYGKLNNVCGGDVVKGKRAGLGYKRRDTDKVLDIKNISTGLKTFVILKSLLQNGVLEYNGTIILDEPEIHLHPEWQLLFAELIVLIQKEFGMHILLNTHSPYFLNAIEVYSAKYEIADKCKYYMAYNENSMSNILDVTNNIEKIYKKLARPLQDLENVRYSND